MTKYREILRLKSLNFSQQNIAHSCNVSKKTVIHVLKCATEFRYFLAARWKWYGCCPCKETFPSAKQVTSVKWMPDYDYIRKELLCNGAPKSSCGLNTWKICRANGDESLMYSQFCYHIQRDDKRLDIEQIKK